MAVATTALTSSQTLLSAFKRTQHPPAGSLHIVNLNEVHLWETSIFEQRTVLVFMAEDAGWSASSHPSAVTITYKQEHYQCKAREKKHHTTFNSFTMTQGMSKWVLKISWSKDRSRHRRLWETSPNRKGGVLQHMTTPAASWSAALSTLPITASTTGGDPGCAVTPSELARKKNNSRTTRGKFFSTSYRRI